MLETHIYKMGFFIMFFFVASCSSNNTSDGYQTTSGDNSPNAKNIYGNYSIYYSKSEHEKTNDFSSLFLEICRSYTNELQTIIASSILTSKSISKDKIIKYKDAAFFMSHVCGCKSRTVKKSMSNIEYRIVSDVYSFFMSHPKKDYFYSVDYDIYKFMDRFPNSTFEFQKILLNYNYSPQRFIDVENNLLEISLNDNDNCMSDIIPQFVENIVMNGVDNSIFKYDFVEVVDMKSRTIKKVEKGQQNYLLTLAVSSKGQVTNFSQFVETKNYNNFFRKGKKLHLIYSISDNRYIAIPKDIKGYFKDSL